MKCTVCGRIIPNNDPFCIYCGNRVDTPDIQDRANCTNCGNKLREGMSFCENCGMPIQAQSALNPHHSVSADHRQSSRQQQAASAKQQARPTRKHSRARGVSPKRKWSYIVIVAIFLLSMIGAGIVLVVDSNGNEQPGSQTMPVSGNASEFAKTLTFTPLSISTAAPTPAPASAQNPAATEIPTATPIPTGTPTSAYIEPVLPTVTADTSSLTDIPEQYEDYQTRNAYATANTNSVNLRSIPDSTGSTALFQVKEGTQVWVYGTFTVDGRQWAYILYNDTDCFVWNELLSNENAYVASNPTETVSQSQVIVVAQNASTVHLRKETSTASDSMGLYFTGTEATCWSDLNDEWVHITIGTETGYMLSSRLRLSSNAGNIQSAQPQALVRDKSGATSVDIFSHPSSNAQLTGSVSTGSYVTVNGETRDHWYYIQTNELVGYAPKEYFSITTEISAAPSTTATTTTDAITQYSDYKTLNTYAVTNKGSVNLRSVPDSSNSSTSLFRVEQGSEVWVYGTFTANGRQWAHIRYNDTDCFVWESLVDVVGSEATSGGDVTIEIYSGGTLKTDTEYTPQYSSLYNCDLDPANRLFDAVSAKLNTRMATRLGPATAYSEELGTLPQSTAIMVIEQIETNGTAWALVDYEYRGKRYRAYTGMKRIDADSQVPLSGMDLYEYSSIAYTLNAADAYYGPGYAYAKHDKQIPANTTLNVIDLECSFLICDYERAGETVRAYVPLNDRVRWDNCPETNTGTANPATLTPEAQEEASGITTEDGNDDLANQVDSPTETQENESGDSASQANTSSTIKESESNDLTHQADEIEIGQTITGTLSHPYTSERDWFKFTVPPGENATVVFETDKQSDASYYWDFYVYPYDNISWMLSAAGIAKQGAANAWGADAYENREPLYHQCIRGDEAYTMIGRYSEGEYYIRVESANAHTTEEYRISIETSADTDSNGLADTAPGYVLYLTYIPGENTTVYERVYDDGYREQISQQGYRADLLRGNIDWSSWGKDEGSVSALDLALLADLSNKTYDEAKAFIIDHFPSASPLRQNSFILGSTSVNYCVFPIDEDHAIVSFGGTKLNIAEGDLIDDILLGAGLGVPQAYTANTMIQQLPYKNIIVTGYSLGGYLAMDVRLNNKGIISECVTFNAPGRGLFNAVEQIFGDSDSHITNYEAVGDNVSKTGLQPGNSISVTIDPNADALGLLGKHDLQYIIDAFLRQ